MTQKRILRANAPKVTRERGQKLRDAVKRYAADPDAAETLVIELAQDDANETALGLFEMANRLIDEVAELTGESRDAIYARVQPD
jgi:hypothetical protein